MAAAFPFKYMGVLIVGIGSAGLFSNFFRAFTLVVFPSDGGPNNEFYGSLLIFFFTAATMIICALTQLYLRTNSFAKFFLSMQSSQSKSEALSDGVDGVNKSDSTSQNDQIPSDKMLPVSAELHPPRGSQASSVRNTDANDSKNKNKTQTLANFMV